MGRPTLTPWLQGAATVAALTLLLAVPALPRGVPELERGLGLNYDVVVGLVGLWGLMWVGDGWRRSAPWRGWLLGTSWAALVGFEATRTASKAATNEILPLYDLVLLVQHLWRLGRELYGAWIDAMPWLALLAVAGLVVVGRGLVGVVESGARLAGPRLSAAGLVLVGLTAAAASPLYGSRWLAPALATNLAESADLYLAVRRDLASRPHRELEDVPLARQPDVLIYIVESYGDVVRTSSLVDRWSLEVEDLSRELEAHGWAVASGRSAAPVHGGRSWIADASLLSGLHVARQATFQHVVALADRIQHLPRFFSDRGYETVLVRPNDRARPGVELVNHFGFAQTVFFEDLHYTGPVVGWAAVPDQYTVEYVHEHVLGPVEAPVFAFFHLATAHVPWDLAPPLLEPYTAWQTHAGRNGPLYEPRSLSSEARMRMSRFKRRRRRPRGTMMQGDPESYLDVVLYDLEVIARTLYGGPQRDQLILILGDHQPPVIAQDMPPDVPVHAVASDPALLDQFYDAGFVPGMVPVGEGRSSLEHRDLFALIVEALR